MRRTVLICSFIISSVALWAQQTVNFIAEDGVVVTADQYVISTQKPYIILLHQEGSSRGEYREIAPKLANLGFNCLAIDLRMGDEINFIKNLTALDAETKSKPISIEKSRQDLRAAIDYVASKSSQPIIVMGSSFSASLAIMEATHNFKIKAVVACSPISLPQHEIDVTASIAKVYVPILATGTKLEYAPMKELLSSVSQKHLTLFRPSQGEGAHGAQSFWEENPNHGEYWMMLSQFFSQLKLK